MKSIFAAIFLFVIIALLAPGIYDYYQRGYHTLPDMAAGAWPINFTNGGRAIMVDIPNELDKRKYLETPMADVPSWFEDAWSFCKKPTDEEEKQINEVAPPDRGMRLDAFCSIDADGEIIPTAIIYSVPRL